MASQYASSFGAAVQGVSIDNNRRLYDFKDRIAELAPQQSPFFVYLSKVAKKTTADPVFKFLERRHQWQRRNFEIHTALSTKDFDADATIASQKLTVHYDEYGVDQGATDKAPQFLLNNQVIVFEAVDNTDGKDVKVYARITANPTVGTTDTTVALEAEAIEKDGTITNASGGTISGYTSVTAADGKKGQVVGSAFAEGTSYPEGWVDALYDREGYCQIFKTAMPMFSGTALATEMRGIKDEWQRVWAEKLMEHKMDMEHASLFGIGKYVGAEDGSTPKRFTWGILPFTESNGKVYNFTYGGSSYDDFLDTSEDFFAPETGNSMNKLVLASRKVINYMQKLQTDSFLKNTVGSSQYRLDVANVPGAFGHQVTRVNTIFGNWNFVQEPLLRGVWEDYAIAVDLKNVKWRPLVGNGVSRDTYIETNVQTPGTDGRIDQILTEAGLEVSLPETHAVLKFA